MKFTVTLALAQITRSAAAAAGLDPKGRGMKPGSRRHRDKKREAARGQVKHRSRALD